MTDPKDNDTIVLHAIAQDVRPNGRHFAKPAACISTPLRKLGEAVCDFNQLVGKPCRGSRVERGDISDDRFEVTDRIVGPNDLPQLIADLGAWQRLPGCPG